MTKLPVAAGLALALVAGSAFAADLPSRKEAPVYIPPAPMFSWTGLYGGVNIGYGFSAGGQWQGVQNAGTFALPAVLPGAAAWSAASNLNGVLGGGQVGYNYQFSPWLVLGFEADIQAADLNHNTSVVTPLGAPFAAGTFGLATNGAHVDWFGTARGRLGLVLPSWPNLMLFGTGGFAYGGVNNLSSYSMATPFFPGGAVVQGSSIFGDTKTGWAAGGGVEWTPMSFPAWSLKIEYLYTDLGTVNQNTLSIANINMNGAAFSTSSTPYRWHTVRAGVNWHFNPFGSSAPVLAKY